MQETSNKKLKKIELTDAPPDITVINPNWDTIDTELQEATKMCIRDRSLRAISDYS